MGQGTSQCLSVMVTTTVCPTMRYSPLTMSWEKRPASLSPTRVALFSFATLLALASSERGSIVVSILKVLGTLFPSSPLRTWVPQRKNMLLSEGRRVASYPRHCQLPGRVGLPGATPRQLGAVGRVGGLPLRLSRPLISVRASSSSLIPAVCRRRPSTSRISSGVRW